MATDLLKCHCYCPMLLMRTTKAAVCFNKASRGWHPRRLLARGQHFGCVPNRCLVNPIYMLGTHTDTQSLSCFKCCFLNLRVKWHTSNDIQTARNLVVIYIFILLSTGTSIVLPVGYMGQPTGLLHIGLYLWRRLCGRQGSRLFR